jgi:hypothetical protein
LDTGEQNQKYTIPVTQEHIDRAVAWVNRTTRDNSNKSVACITQNCIIALALKDAFGTDYARVGSDTTSVGPERQILQLSVEARAVTSLATSEWGTVKPFVFTAQLAGDD